MCQSTPPLSTATHPNIPQAARSGGFSDSDAQLSSGAHEDNPEAEAACPGWQEAYFVLVLLEKIAAQAGAALEWSSSSSSKKKGKGKGAENGDAGGGGSSKVVVGLWEAVVRLLLHRHLWVRKAAARLVGHALASPRVCEGLMGSRAGRAGQLAFSLYLQLECEVTDEAACLQAVKCLVALTPHLQQESDEGEEGAKGVAQNGHGNGVAGGGVLGEEGQDEEEDGAGEGEEEEGGDEEGEEEEEEEEEGGGAAAAEEDAADDAGDDVSMAAQVQRRAFTLRGLVRRMARLADDARWTRQRQRLAALRWTAAVASVLGSAGVAPHLPVLLRPLFRISEAAAAAATAATAAGGVSRGGSGLAAAATARMPEEVQELSEEVMAHLRTLVGSEVLLAGYNAARDHVKKQRASRKKKAAVRGMVDPAAAAAARLRHNARKAEGKKRKMEIMKRERGARQLKQTGRRFGGNKRQKQG